MARLAGRHEVVHEIHVANERGVVTGRAIRSGVASADKSGSVSGAEVLLLLTKGSNGRTVARRICARQLVEDPQLQRVDSFLGDLFERTACCEGPEILRHLRGLAADRSADIALSCAESGADLFGRFDERRIR